MRGDDVRPLPLLNQEFSGQQLFSLVWDVPPESAAQVASLFERVAAELRNLDQVHQRSRELSDAARRHLFSLRQLPFAVESLLNDGLTLEQAAQHLHKANGVQIETVHAHWRAHQKKIAAVNRSRRDFRIMQLRREGYSDPAIARAVGLSVRQVQRVFRQMLER